jgi:hypothetical protein
MYLPQVLFRKQIILPNVRCRISAMPSASVFTLILVPAGNCATTPLSCSWSWSCGRQSVDQYVWVSGLLFGPLTRFYLALLSCNNYVVLHSMRPLWRENGSVIYCWIASGPRQSNHTWAEVPQNSRPYLPVSFETPPTWRVRFPYLYPPGTGWPSYNPGHWVPFLSPLTTRRDYGESILTRLHTGYSLKQPTVLPIPSRYGPSRKHRSFLLYPLADVHACLFAKPLLGKRCCTFVFRLSLPNTSSIS